ncbi:PRAF1 protein, partial [Atractosteus spatula]|nr:PRAF1 protein [Atractosteus spatula]
MAREWLERRRAAMRPWAGFVDQRRFSKPRNFGDLCQRVVRNLDTYQSNYTFIFLGLILYCIISSPLLLLALAVFVGAFYVIHLKSLEKKLVLFGREVTGGHQLALAGAVSFPVFWLAGAGAAVFWVLVSVCISGCVFQWVYISVCISVSVGVCISGCILVCVSVYQCVCVSVGVCISVCISGCVFQWVCVSVSVSVGVCISEYVFQ